MTESTRRAFALDSPNRFVTAGEQHCWRMLTHSGKACQSAMKTCLVLYEMRLGDGSIISKAGIAKPRNIEGAVLITSERGTRCLFAEVRKVTVGEVRRCNKSKSGAVTA